MSRRKTAKLEERFKSKRNFTLVNWFLKQGNAVMVVEQSLPLLNQLKKTYITDDNLRKIIENASKGN